MVVEEKKYADDADLFKNKKWQTSTSDYGRRNTFRFSLSEKLEQFLKDKVS